MIPLWLTLLIWGGSTFDLYVGKLDTTFTQISAVNYYEKRLDRDWSVTLPSMDVGTARAVTYNLNPWTSSGTDDWVYHSVKIYLPSQGQYLTGSGKIETVVSKWPAEYNDSAVDIHTIAGGTLCVSGQVGYIRTDSTFMSSPFTGTIYVARFS